MTLRPMLRLFSSKAQRHIFNDLLKPSKPCHVDIHRIALVNSSQMSFLHHFVLAKLASRSIRVKLTPNITPFVGTNSTEI